MDTAAVILNHNDNANTLRLAAQLAGVPGMGRVVVVDNSGAGGLQPGALPEACELLRVQNTGYAAGNNAGLRFLERDAPQFVLIANPDVFLEPEAVEACARFLEMHPGYAVAAPRMCRADGTPHPLAAWRERSFFTDIPYTSGLLSRLLGMGRECYPESVLAAEAADVDCVAGSCFLARFSMLREAGCFDEGTFLYYEEDILGYRLKRLGYKTAVLGRQRFLHCEGASVNRTFGLLRRYRAMQKSRLYFHRRYLKTPAPLYALLCAATVLGVAEKALKTAFYRLRGAAEAGGSGD